jgi:drug/metabolite transporter (DMT)-like permease
MPHLLAVSLLWAFSFGLTKGKLVGLDSAFISAARLLLALLVFLPFLRLRGMSVRLAALLAAIGAVQFGLMYLALNASYRYLQAYEVVLFTITTPILVTLFADGLDRTLRRRALAAATLAVAGAALLVVRSSELKLTLTGVLLVQASNAAFALGQIAYQRVRRRRPELRDRDVFGLLYFGAAATAVLAMLGRDISVTLTTPQLLTLLYLGVLASGVGFFLWNVGATKVSSGTLAVMNNAKVPLGVACSLLFFGETAPLLPLLGSFGVLALAVWLAQPKRSAAA